MSATCPTGTRFDRTTYVDLPPFAGYDPDVWAGTVACTVVTITRLAEAYAEVDADA